MVNDVNTLPSLNPGLQASPPLPSRKAPATDAEVKKMAGEFSALLLSELLKAMRATLANEGFDGDRSAARDNYMSLADAEVTRSLAKRDGMGLAAFLERALSKLTPKSDIQAALPAEAYKNNASVDRQTLLHRYRS